MSAYQDRTNRASLRAYREHQKSRRGGCPHSPDCAMRAGSASKARKPGWGNTRLREHLRIAAFFWLLAVATASTAQTRDWPVYGGSWENQHYSPLTQINKSNVKQLQVAWTYDTQESG